MKKATTIYLITFLAMVLFAACSSPKYFGKTYAPTQNVDVYLDKADVKKNFTTIGTTSVGKGFGSIEAAQQKVVELGKAKGADGVIVTLTEEVVSTQQTGSEFVNKTNRKNVTKTNSSNTTDIKTKKITATFIKYE